MSGLDNEEEYSSLSNELLRLDIPHHKMDNSPSERVFLSCKSQVSPSQSWNPTSHTPSEGIAYQCQKPESCHRLVL